VGSSCERLGATGQFIGVSIRFSEIIDTRGVTEEPSRTGNWGSDSRSRAKFCLKNLLDRPDQAGRGKRNPAPASCPKTAKGPRGQVLAD
jgi:hypothetical protein